MYTVRAQNQSMSFKQSQSQDVITGRYITRLRMHDLRNKNYSVNSLRYYVSEGDGVLRCDWLTQGLFCLKVCLRLTGVVEIRRI